MHLPLDEAITRLQADARYADEFAAAFAAPPSRVTLQRALATFVRGIVRGDAPYDRFVAGDAAALTPEQRTGLWLFESKGGCWQCHTPPLFTDDGFHNTGVGVQHDRAEPGRAQVTGKAVDTGRWKTPTLRGVRLTAPFMHDGSLATLDDVVAFYARGGDSNVHLDQRLRPVDLTANERTALVAFLSSL
jgi:cytochrome c peroxidase